MKTGLSKLLAVIIALAMFAVLPACGQDKVEQKDNSQVSSSQDSSTKQSDSEPSKKEPVTIVLQTFNQWNDDGLKEGVRMAEEKTGNKIDVQVFPDDQFANLIKTKIATGDVPDVIGIWPNTNGSSVPINNFETLEGAWIDKIPEDHKKNYYSDPQGNVLTAPFGQGSNLGAIYNKEVMKKAGLTPPFKSYNELLAACEAIKKINVTPIYLPNKDNWTAQIYFLCGLNYVFEKSPDLAGKIQSNQVKLSQSPELVDAFNRAYGLVKKGYVNTDYLSATYQMAEKAVAEGTAGIFLGVDAFYNDIKKDYPDKLDNVGMMPFTLGDDFISVEQNSSQKGLWVPKGAKNKEAAKEFINVIMSDDVMKAMYKKVPGPSPLKDLELDMNAWNKEMMEYGKQIPIMSEFRLKYFVGFDLGDFGGHAQAFFAGKKVDKALDDWYSDYAKVAKNKKVSGF